MKINAKGPIVGNGDAWLYDFFGMDYTAPKTISDALEQANGEDVEIEINSPGGYVSAGYEMYAGLMNYEGRVTAHVICAASAATFLLCAADEVLISDAGYIMVHNASTYASGNKNDMQQSHDHLQAIDEGIINAYVRKTGKTRDELQELMDNETYMSPARAIELGFADGYLFGNPECEETNSTAQQFVALNAPVIPTEKIKELAIAMEKGKVAPVQQATKKDPAKVVSDREEAKKKEEEKMTLAELAKEHPEISAEIDALKKESFDSGAESERNRIQSLDAIAKTVTPEALNEAKYGENKTDGKTLAYDAMVNGETLAEAYLKKAQEDSEDSEADKVGVEKQEEDDESVSNQMAEHVNAMKKGV